MTDTERDAKILSLESQFAAFLAGTVSIEALNQAQRRTIIESIFPNGVAIWYSDPSVEVGDKVFGWGAAGINGGGTFIAEVVSTPVTSNSNLNFKLQS